MAPSTPVINVDTTPVLKHLVQFNPSSQLPIKMCGRHNFTICKAQISMLLHGHALYGHLDGTKLSPLETIITNGLVTANLEYKDWFCQDKFIQNALMASVDATIASTIASVANSKAAWDQLHTLFANKSQTRIFSLRHYLSRISATIRAGDSPISYAELFDKLLDHELFLKHEDLQRTTT
ncbi:hypothetical protein KY290_010710 [Solanum tuberosum]|uniref:Integrase core domain containing protein n=1 Tax=Solanum tuberosum TaxID=4113 RepID=A0ABQ7VYJ0_SOLTU|nr:hypothetical protein KY290_010710 [Solanum tuberosum]